MHWWRVREGKHKLPLQARVWLTVRGGAQALQGLLQERDARLAAAERGRAQLDPLQQQLASAEVRGARQVVKPERPPFTPRISVRCE